MSYLELEINGLAGLDIVDKKALLIACSHLQCHLKKRDELKVFTEPDSDLSVPRSGLHPGCQCQDQDYEDDAPQSLHASCIILPVPVCGVHCR